jgi:hypothetical protein
MFLERILAASRLFSTSAILQGAKYKLKSHSGAKKRWRSLSGGNYKRVRKTAEPPVVVASTAYHIAGESGPCTSQRNEKAWQDQPARADRLFDTQADSNSEEVVTIRLTRRV